MNSMMRNGLTFQSRFGAEHDASLYIHRHLELVGSRPAEIIERLLRPKLIQASWQFVASTNTPRSRLRGTAS